MKVLMKVLAMWLSVAAPVVVAAAIVVLSTSVVGNVMAQSQEEVWFSDLVVEDFTSGDLEYLGYWEGERGIPCVWGVEQNAVRFPRPTAHGQRGLLVFLGGVRDCGSAGSPGPCEAQRR